MNVFFGQEAVKIWHNNEGNGMLSFPVNSRMSAFICAIERDQKGKFVVDALSSDGGVFPRNFILKYGFALLNFGALTIEDFVKKSSLQPAKILGLSNKGHFSPGADADIIVVDPKTFEVKMVIIGGKLSMAANSVIDAPGKIITTPKGIQNLKNKKIKFQTINFKKSLYYNGKNNNTDQQYCI
jgi:hypothetical protein